MKIWACLLISAAPAWAQPQVRELKPTSGRAGSMVQLLGSGFGQQAAEVKVTFGGVPAEVTTVAEEQVTVRVPDTAPKNAPVQVQVGSEKSTPQLFTCTPSVRLSVAKNPIEPGERTTCRFQVFHDENPMPISFKNASPAIVRFVAGDQQSVKSCGGASNVFDFEIEGLAGNRLFTVDYSWGSQAIELIEWKLPWNQLDWTPKVPP